MQKLQASSLKDQGTDTNRRMSGKDLNTTQISFKLERYQNLYHCLNEDDFDRITHTPLYARRNKQLQKIKEFMPDVLCLQEVEYFSEWQSALGQVGYEGHYIGRPTKQDGSAIFWKKDVFVPIEIRDLDFSKQRLGLNEGLIVVLGANLEQFKKQQLDQNSKAQGNNSNNDNSNYNNNNGNHNSPSSNQQSNNGIPARNGLDSKQKFRNGTFNISQKANNSNPFIDYTMNDNDNIFSVQNTSQDVLQKVQQGQIIPVVVGCTHLIYSPEEGHQKIGQALFMLNQMRELQDKYNANCLFAGDMNFFPDSGIYRLIKSGALNLIFEDPALTVSGQRMNVLKDNQQTQFWSQIQDLKSYFIQQVQDLYQTDNQIVDFLKVHRQSKLKKTQSLKRDQPGYNRTGSFGANRQDSQFQNELNKQNDRFKVYHKSLSMGNPQVSVDEQEKQFKIQKANEYLKNETQEEEPEQQEQEQQLIDEKLMEVSQNLGLQLKITDHQIERLFSRNEIFEEVKKRPLMDPFSVYVKNHGKIYKLKYWNRDKVKLLTRFMEESQKRKGNELTVLFDGVEDFFVKNKMIMRSCYQDINNDKEVGTTTCVKLSQGTSDYIFYTPNAKGRKLEVQKQDNVNLDQYFDCQEGNCLEARIQKWLMQHYGSDHLPLKFQMKLTIQGVSKL